MGVAAETNAELVEIAQVARAVALAIAQIEEDEPGQVGVSIDVEATLQGLMIFAAGIIGKSTNLAGGHIYVADATETDRATTAVE